MATGPLNYLSPGPSGQVARAELTLGGRNQTCVILINSVFAQRIGPWRI